jgi:hypothetical protein
VHRARHLQLQGQLRIKAETRPHRIPTGPVSGHRRDLEVRRNSNFAGADTRIVRKRLAGLTMIVFCGSAVCFVHRWRESEVTPEWSGAAQF